MFFFHHHLSNYAKNRYKRLNVILTYRLIQEICNLPGKTGEWIFELPNAVSSRHAQRCLRWAKRQSRVSSLRRLALYLRRLPRCPCKLNQARLDGSFIFSDYSKYCIITWGKPGNIYSFYRVNISAIITIILWL